VQTCVDKIEVHYINRRGIVRVPVVRTCTPMIELSMSYASYTELRAEFINLLAVNQMLIINVNTNNYKQLNELLPESTSLCYSLKSIF
jgi:hypothetical protein